MYVSRSHGKRGLRLMWLPLSRPQSSAFVSRLSSLELVNTLGTLIYLGPGVLKELSIQPKAQLGREESIFPNLEHLHRQ